MGTGFFGIGGSDSTSTDNTVAAREQAQVIGRTGSILNPGSVQLQTNANLVTGGLQIQKGAIGSKGTLVINDTKPLEDLSKNFSSTIAGITDQTSSAIRDLSASSTATLKDALDQISSLGQSNQTGGVSTGQKTVLYMVLGALFLIGAVIYFLRK